MTNTNQIPLIKIDKKTTNKIEQAKTVASLFCNIYNIKLSDTELSVLAYFMVYKITEQTKQLILKSKVLLSINSYDNLLSKLKKLGLVYKKNKTNLITEKLNFELSSVIGIIIKIDNR